MCGYTERHETTLLAKLEIKKNTETEKMWTWQHMGQPTNSSGISQLVGTVSRSICFAIKGAFKTEEIKDVNIHHTFTQI